MVLIPQVWIDRWRAARENPPGYCVSVTFQSFFYLKLY